ncbi:MAG TPA: type II toxin-antitoxin system RelE/ParE family toxin [bacterium]|nr:type II toxin-antitoxin system RelE/ParE family toxin [bacterium]
MERRVREQDPWQGEQVPRYGRDRKDLSPAVLKEVNETQSRILQDPYRGDRKGGTLRNVWMEKFKAENDQWLVAYTLFERIRRVRFLAVGQHENSYRDVTTYLGKQKEAFKE